MAMQQQQQQQQQLLPPQPQPQSHSQPHSQPQLLPQRQLRQYPSELSPAIQQRQQRQQPEDESRKMVVAAAEQVLRLFFSMLHRRGPARGMVDKVDVLDALQVNGDAVSLVRAFPPLKPLLDPLKYRATFSRLRTDVHGQVHESDFVACGVTCVVVPPQIASPERIPHISVGGPVAAAAAARPHPTASLQPPPLQHPQQHPRQQNRWSKPVRQHGPVHSFQQVPQQHAGHPFGRPLEHPVQPLQPLQPAQQFTQPPQRFIAPPPEQSQQPQPSHWQAGVAPATVAEVAAVPGVMPSVRRVPQPVVKSASDGRLPPVERRTGLPERPLQKADLSVPELHQHDRGQAAAMVARQRRRDSGGGAGEGGKVSSRLEDDDEQQDQIGQEQEREHEPRRGGNRGARVGNNENSPRGKVKVFRSLSILEVDPAEDSLDPLGQYNNHPGAAAGAAGGAVARATRARARDVDREQGRSRARHQQRDRQVLRRLGGGKAVAVGNRKERPGGAWH